MHLPIFYAAALWLVALLGVSMWLILRGKSIMIRILAFDTMSMIVVGLLVLFAHFHRSAYYLDAALLTALLSFVGTLAAARYASGRGLFS